MKNKIQMTEALFERRHGHSLAGCCLMGLCGAEAAADARSLTPHIVIEHGTATVNENGAAKLGRFLSAQDGRIKVSSDAQIPGGGK